MSMETGVCPRTLVGPSATQALFTNGTKSSETRKKSMAGPWPRPPEVVDDHVLKIWPAGPADVKTSLCCRSSPRAHPLEGSQRPEDQKQHVCCLCRFVVFVFLRFLYVLSLFVFV